jgi:hypothetical protein
MSLTTLLGIDVSNAYHALHIHAHMTLPDFWRPPLPFGAQSSDI